MALAIEARALDAAQDFGDARIGLGAARRLRRLGQKLGQVVRHQPATQKGSLGLAERT
jgi:hypothetical protein